MDTWHRVDAPLADLLAKLPTPPPRQQPISTYYAPLVGKYPALSALPDEELARLGCGRCGSSGKIGSKDGDYACADCRGSGLVCPRCSGAGWVVDAASGPAGRRGLVRCQGCLTTDGRNATILSFVAQANRALADAPPAAA